MRRVLPAQQEKGRVHRGRVLLRCRKCGREEEAGVLTADPRFWRIICRAKGRPCLGLPTLFPVRDVRQSDGPLHLSRPDPGVDERTWDAKWNAMTVRIAEEEKAKEDRKRERLRAFLAKRKQEEIDMATTATQKSAPAKVQKLAPAPKKITAASMVASTTKKPPVLEKAPPARKASEVDGKGRVLKTVSAKKAAPVKKEKGESRRGRIFCFDKPATAVLRAMGKHGFSLAQARAAMEKLHVEVSKASIIVFIIAGRHGQRGEPAKLTQDEIKKLKDACKGVE